MTSILSAIYAEWPGAVAMPAGATPEYELTPRQRDAVIAAGGAGGAYLGKLRKTDVGQLTTEQWDSFIETVVRGYLYAIASSSDLPANDGE